MIDYIASFETLNFQLFQIVLILQSCSIPNSLRINHFRKIKLFCKYVSEVSYYGESIYKVKTLITKISCSDILFGKFGFSKLSFLEEVRS